MFNIVVTTNSLFMPVVQGLHALSEGIDLSPLAATIAQMMWQDRIDAQLRGQDGHGEPMVELSPATIKRRKTTGQPLSTLDSSSQVCTNYQVTIEHDDSDHIILRGTWEGIPWLIYHLEGCPPLPGRRDMPNWSLPQRDIAHIRPETWERIGAVVHDYCVEAVAHLFTGGFQL